MTSASASSFLLSFGFLGGERRGTNKYPLTILLFFLFSRVISKLASRENGTLYVLCATRFPRYDYEGTGPPSIWCFSRLVSSLFLGSTPRLWDK